MDSDIRSNVGFLIIASERNSAGEEIVLGYNPDSKLYVTWLCLGGYDYNTAYRQIRNSADYRGEWDVVLSAFSNAATMNEVR